MQLDLYRLCPALNFLLNHMSRGECFPNSLQPTPSAPLPWAQDGGVCLPLRPGSDRRGGVAASRSRKSVRDGATVRARDSKGFVIMLFFHRRFLLCFQISAYLRRGTYVHVCSCVGVRVYIYINECLYKYVLLIHPSVYFLPFSSAFLSFLS